MDTKDDFVNNDIAINIVKAAKAHGTLNKICFGLAWVRSIGKGQIKHVAT